MTLPATTVEAERSFSCMRRVKTWFRLAMASDRLSDLCVLHCHQERLDKENANRIQPWLAKSDNEWPSEGDRQLI